MRRLNRRRVFDSTRGKYVNKRPNQGMQSKELIMTEAAVEECLARQEELKQRRQTVIRKPKIVSTEIHIVIDLTTCDDEFKNLPVEASRAPKVGDTLLALGDIALHGDN